MIEEIDDSGQGFIVRTEQGLVEAWSTVRLPFEPKGWLRELRRALRSSLRDMPAKSEHVLHASYQSRVRARVDAENVLLYNVGPGAVTHLSTLGIRFDRGYDPPAAPHAGLAPTPLHYCRYTQELLHAGHLSASEGSVLARFDEVPLDSLCGAAEVFFAVRRHAEHPSAATYHPGAFRVAVQLRRPRSSTTRPATILKTLLDGVICAYHAHEGPVRLVSQRLAAAGFGEDAHVTGHLVDPRWNLLGGRQLVWPYRTGVMWNPGDDRCVAAEVLLVGNAPGSRWLISGEIIGAPG